jgi:hypothetical protein
MTHDWYVCVCVRERMETTSTSTKNVDKHARHIQTYVQTYKRATRYMHVQSLKYKIIPVSILHDEFRSMSREQS